MWNKIIFLLKRNKIVDENTIAIYYEKKILFIAYISILFVIYMQISLILLGGIATMIGLFFFTLSVYLIKITYKNLLYPIAIFTEMYISRFDKTSKIYFEDIKKISMEHDINGRSYLHLKMKDISKYDSKQYDYDSWNEDTIVFGLMILDWKIDKEKMINILNKKVEETNFNLVNAFYCNEEYK